MEGSLAKPVVQLAMPKIKIVSIAQESQHGRTNFFFNDRK
jgi:hypothetical protein